MEIPILETKLFRPSRRRSTVSRDRLICRLEESLRNNRMLTLVSAPAGYGKTTLIGDWLEMVDEPVGWLSLDEQDNDFHRFIVYLIAALRKVEKELGQSVMSVLKSVRTSSSETLITLLINEILGISSRIVLVLDDYFFIRDKQIHGGIDFLLNNLPHNLHMVLISRRDPPFSLARIRAQGQLTEIRTEDLQFRIEEAREFFHSTLNLPFDGETVALLEARTEGWVSGLQLAGLSLKGRNPQQSASFLRSFSGRHRNVVDYLGCEVLSVLSEDMRDFLKRTSILDRMTPSLCDALTARANSRDVLLDLEKSNLFLVALDDQRSWFRYHHLFRDFLRTGLDEATAADLHRKASRWFEANQLIPEAVDHALLGGDAEEAVRLIRAVADSLVQAGYVMTFLQWLDRLPDEIVRGDAALATDRALILMFMGQMEAAESYLRCAEKVYDEHSDSPRSGRFLIAKAAGLFVSSDPGERSAIEEINRYLDAGLRRTQDGDLLTRGVGMILLGETRMWMGDVAGSLECLEDALLLGEKTNQPMIVMGALSDLVLMLSRQGRRGKAVELCRDVLSKYTMHQSNLPPIAAIACCLLGDLEYEADNLELAEGLVIKGLKLSRRLGIDISAQTRLASIHEARGEPSKALDVILESLRGAEKTGYQKGVIAQSTMEVEYCIRHRQLDRVEKWAASLDVFYLLSHLANTFEEAKLLALVRFQLARKQCEAANSILDKHERWAKSVGYHGSLLTNYLLRTRSHVLAGTNDRAEMSLRKAVELAAPEGYIRRFLDEKLPLADLLSGIDTLQGSFVETLLDHARRDYSRLSSSGKELLPSQPSGDELSRREKEILALLASGLSNREIAERSYIAVSTVKTHINSIYGKLGVKSRTQAVAAARERKLL